jgi:hypothetical protein
MIVNDKVMVLLIWEHDLIKYQGDPISPYLFIIGARGIYNNFLRVMLNSAPAALVGVLVKHTKKRNKRDI